MRAAPLLALLTASALTFGSSEEASKWLAEVATRSGVIKTASGLMYKVLERGSGEHHPTRSSRCEVHYTGFTHKGRMFDSSHVRGQPSTFFPTQVIPGWEEALQLMVEGDKWELYIPSELGYGDEGGAGGAIRPGDALQFSVELLRISGEKALTQGASERHQRAERAEELRRTTAQPPCEPFGLKNCLSQDRAYVTLMADKPVATLERELRREQQGAVPWGPRRAAILAAMLDVLRPGEFVLSSKVTLRADADGLGTVVGELPSGTRVEVVEVARRPQRRRVRGRIESPIAGWFSLVSGDNGRRWAVRSSDEGGEL